MWVFVLLLALLLIGIFGSVSFQLAVGATLFCFYVYMKDDDGR